MWRFTSLLEWLYIDMIVYRYHTYNIFVYTLKQTIATYTYQVSVILYNNCC